MNRVNFVRLRGGVIGLLMFLIIVIAGYLLSSLFSWSFAIGNWGIFSKIVFFLSIIYALISIKYNSKETQNEINNANDIDGEMLKAYDEIRFKTRYASSEQKLAILYQCTKMTKYAEKYNDNDLYRASQRMEYLMSEAMNVQSHDAIKFFNKKDTREDMEILSTIKENTELRDYLIFFFNIYSHVSSNTLDFNGGPSSFRPVSSLCSEIETALGVSHNERNAIILNYKLSKQ